MISLDTNVLVRLLTRDDPAQVRAAVRVIRGRRLWLAKTVVLETEWVLRYSYELSSEAIHRSFQRLLGLRNLEVEDRECVLIALGSYAGGMDLADALHLASSRLAEAFVTFDARLAKVAARLNPGPRVQAL